ncbi:hypothetical protein D3C80_543080 [compost metagenome]
MAPVFHQREKSLGQEERPLEMDVEETVELLLRHLGERGIEAVAGIVDQEVECRPAPDRLKRFLDDIVKSRE